MIVDNSMVLGEEAVVYDFLSNPPALNSLIRLFRKKGKTYRSISITGIGTPTIDSIGVFSGIDENYIMPGTNKHVVAIIITDPRNGSSFKQNIEELYWTPISKSAKTKVEKRSSGRRNRHLREVSISMLKYNRN
ncbi:MAG: hypothetical protein M1338_03085 [Patescibacteria group bacterium]|nr:hypothetical protein [Patescibacteria group bacterium]